jgi:hypothetical protein
MGKMHYVLRMVVFIILVSYLSAISSLPFGFLFGFVSPVLSFPFYTWMHDVAEPDSYYTVYRGFGLLTTTFTTATDISWGDFVNFSFLIFLLINFAGAMLGYGISKIRRIREWGTSTHWSLLGSVLAIIFLGGPYVLGPGDYGFANGALFLFGILVLAIVIGRILWSKISQCKLQAR